MGFMQKKQHEPLQQHKMSAITIIASKMKQKAMMKIWGASIDHEATSEAKLGLSKDQIDSSTLFAVTDALTKIISSVSERSSVPSSF